MGGGSKGTTFTVGEVMGAPRPRFVKGTGRTYMPDKYAKHKERVARAYRDAGGEVLGGPVSVDIGVTRHLPGSRPKRVEREPDTVKPDADNVAKAVLDALNGVAYADDAQVVSLRVTKHPRRRGAPDRMRVSVAPYSEKKEKER